MDIKLALAAVLAAACVGSARGGCYETNCASSFPGCAPGHYWTGQVNRWGDGSPWFWCGWAWETRYLCCQTASPTTAPPTPQPTMRPSLKPTEKPTLTPTEKPTLKPTEKPTTTAPSNSPTTLNPTQSPTQEPSVAPTGVPSLTPTTEPPLLVGRCTSSSKEDAVKWAEKNKATMYADMQACSSFCNLSNRSNSSELASCMTLCLSSYNETWRPYGFQGLGFSRPCASCFGEYAECLVDRCGCSTGRDQSFECGLCARTTCEPDLRLCTGFNEFLAASTQAAQQGEESSVSLGIWVSCGVLVLLVLVIFLVCGVRKPRSWRQKTSIIDTNDKFKAGAVAAGAAVPISEEPNVAKAAYSFPAGRQDELSCEQGELLEVVSFIDSDWAMCLRPGAPPSRGLVPRSYLCFSSADTSFQDLGTPPEVPPRSETVAVV